MDYDIRLRIRYHYGAPAAGRHVLRLLPADLPGQQQILQSSLAIVPEPAERTELADFFGNPMVEVAFDGGKDSVLFEARARVRRLPPGPAPDTSPPPGDLAQQIRSVRSLQPAAPHHFLGNSPRIRPWPEITAHARAATAKARTTCSAVQQLGVALHAEMRFDATATTVDTPLLEAFHRREGVCQDFAQVMVAGLRGLGIPAGYVSGYLRTTPPPGRARLEGADAMHAWVRAWCGVTMGWVDYDPTNACFAGEDHVTVAIGRDYGDAAPVAGVLRIAGRQRSSQAVDMIPLPDPDPGLNLATTDESA